MKNTTKKRIPYWDNIKGLLIILVVVGHLIESLPQGQLGLIYKLIYLFHMPLFVFVSGYMAKFNLKKNMKAFLLPYLVIQPICCIATGNPIQWTTPFWILWYLISLFIWYLCVPVLEKIPTRYRPLLIIVSIIIACLIGYNSNIGYYASVSRSFVFFPYFALGYYSKYYYSIHKHENFINRNEYIIKIAISALVFFILGVLIIKGSALNAKWLYGAYSYTTANYSILYRLMHYSAAIILGCFIMIFIPHRKSVLTEIGQNSFKIYLTHMIIVPALNHLFNLLTINNLLGEAICIILGIIFCITLVKGNLHIQKRFSL